MFTFLTYLKKKKSRLKYSTCSEVEYNEIISTLLLVKVCSETKFSNILIYKFLLLTRYRFPIYFDIFVFIHENDHFYS